MLEESPLNTIVVFAHVELSQESFVGAVLRALNVVKELMRDQEVVVYHSVRDKCALVRGDTPGQEKLQSVSPYLSHDFI